MTAIRLLAALMCCCWSCARETSSPVQEETPPPVIPVVDAPQIPLLGAGGFDDESGTDRVKPEELLAGLLSVPERQRYTTPGGVRFVMPFDGPVESIQWSPHAGFALSVGAELHNVSSRGVHRWQTRVGRNHRVFSVDDEEMVWSGEFDTLFQVRRGGRFGWRRDWRAGPPVWDGNQLFLQEASTVSRVRAGGTEEWRVVVNDVRDLAGPFGCGDWMLFQGKRGQRVMAVTISNTGELVRETELPPHSVILGASTQCDPIVWSAEEVMRMDFQGRPLWSFPFASVPLFSAMPGGYLLLVPDPMHPIRVVSLNTDGRVKFDARLPVSGRISTMRAEVTGTGLQLVGICKDMASPCTRPDWRRGPFNMLVIGRPGGYSVLERVIGGHINLVMVEGVGFMTATSSVPDRTVVTLRDEDGGMLWSVTLPGRLSTGPYIGPRGGAYVGTCAGWDCESPHRFVALTVGNEQEQE